MSRDELLRTLRARNLDAHVLAAVARVPRELFVAAPLRQFAYADRPLPIGGGQTISQPTLVARMVQLLELTGDDLALDVGSGSGYHAALLSRLCHHVYGVELDEQLAEQARHALALAGIENVTIVAGDGAAGLPERAPFDAINVAAAASGDVPPALERQLAVGGRLVAPVARGDDEHLVLVQRDARGCARTLLDAVHFVPLR
ncbi:MAG: protein-L-isoaspartate(D-aspartate) O-methyltransferase [Solirubrobacteraceae bacterium]|nr:protein-L-isoaspartate(D-aspartate) O-methyltransferase [Solirubrobacteraceae bacterium]